MWYRAMSKYATFEAYWKDNWTPSVGSLGGSLPVLDAAFKEVAEKAWNASFRSTVEAAAKPLLMERTYPNGECFYIDNNGKRTYGNRITRNVRFKKTGEFRTPKKGEWYLSGANPHAYMAANNFISEYNILVRV